MEIRDLIKKLKRLGYVDFVKYDSNGKVSNYDIEMVLLAIGGGELK